MEESNDPMIPPPPPGRPPIENLEKKNDSKVEIETNLNKTNSHAEKPPPPSDPPPKEVLVSSPSAVETRKPSLTIETNDSREEEPPAIQPDSLVDSIKITKERKKSKRLSGFGGNLADLTKAMTVDSGMKSRLYVESEKMTIKQFKKWITAGSSSVVYHPERGEPFSIWLWLDSDGSTLKFDKLGYKCCSTSSRRHFDPSHFIDSVDLREVGDIRWGRNTTTLKRTTKYVDDDEVVEEETIYFSLVTRARSYDFDVDTPEDFAIIVDGLVNVLEEASGPFVSANQEFKDLHSVENTSGMTARIHALMYNKCMDRLILTCIILSVVSMAYSGKGADPGALGVLSVLEYVVAVIFTFEAIFRIIALEGIVPYLKNPWNALDFTIVCLGWITELPFMQGKANFSAFRAFRALRALRTMKYLQGLRQVVDTFIATLEGIVYALFVYMYFCWLFAIVALDVFGDAMSYRCVVPKDTESLRPFQNFTYGIPHSFCADHAAVITESNSNSSAVTDPSCPLGQFCQGVNGQMVGFRDLGTAFLTVMKIASKAPGMSNIMKPIMGATSDLFILYFISITVFVSALVLALFIAIVRISFIQTKRKNKEADEARLHSEKIKIKKQERAKVAPETVVGEEKQKPAAGSKIVPVSHGADEAAGAVVVKGESRNGRVCGLFNPDGCFVNGIRKFILHPRTDNCVMGAILINCLFLAMEKHPMEDWYKNMLRQCEVTFTFLFLAEMILKIIGLKGWKNYLWNDINWAWNGFDAFIVTVTLVDFFTSQYATGFVNISFLRVFRVGRLMRMLRSNKDLMKIIEAIINSLPAMGNVLMFMTLILVLFAILGMQLFGGNFPEEEQWIGGELKKVTVRSNFDDFLTSMFTLFKVLTGGGGTWGLMYSAMKTPSGAAAPFFFVIFSVLSSSILLNFLIVILMSQFALSKEEKEDMRNERTALMRRRASVRITGSSRLAGHNLSSNRQFGSPPGSAPISSRVNLGWRRLFVPRCIKLEKLNHSFGMPGTHPLRMKLKAFVENTNFEAFIIGAIVCSSLFLALESPTYNDSTLELVMYIADVFFMVVFCIEMVLKIIAYGFILPSNSYLSDAWNRLDFFVIIVTFVGMTGEGSSIGRTLRVGRILRPLRMINRNEGMKVIVDALLRSMTPVFYTVIILLAYFFLFGVLGVSLFAGRFYSCNDKSVVYKSNCTGVYINKAGLLAPRVWSNPPYNFDNIFSAIRTLFEVVARRGWLGPLYSAMDVTEIDKQPSRNNSPEFAVYFVFFIFIGANFMLKIFVGIIVGTFRKFSGTALYTEAQLKWLVTKRMIASVKPKFRRPHNKLQGRAHDIVTNKHFEDVMTITIIIQLIFLGTKQASSAQKGSVITSVHWVFTALYSVETVLRLLAFGFRRFAYQFWNVWDALVVTLMILLPVTANIYKGVGVLRAVQFSRITRLLRRFRGIEKLFDVLVKSVPPMLNVTALFLLLIYVFAVLGMQLFSTVKKGKTLDVVADFTTFPASVVTLYEVVAGENWMNIMRDVSLASPKCTESYPVASETWFGNKAKGDCGDPVLGPLFFFAFFILVFCVFLNLYVATILDTFSAVAATERKNKHHAHREVGVTWEDFQFYRDIWHIYDPDSTGSIDYNEVKNVTRDLNNKEECTIGLDPVEQKGAYMQLMAQLDLEINLSSQRRISNTSGDVSPASKGAGSHNMLPGIPPSPRNSNSSTQVTFAMLLQNLCSRSIPEDALGADEYVKAKLQGEMVNKVIAVLKIQHAVKDWLGRKNFLKNLRKLEDAGKLE